MGVKSSQLQIRVSPEQKAAIAALATSAGLDMSEWVLSRLLPATQRRFHRLVGELPLSSVALKRDEGAERRRVKYVWAALNDFLSELSRYSLPAAVATLPHALSQPLDPYALAYLAAMVELASFKRQVMPPSWTRQVAALPMPVFGSDLIALRAHLLLSSPPPFRKRNIFIDASIGDRL